MPDGPILSGLRLAVYSLADKDAPANVGNSICRRIDLRYWAIRS
jgi:hypothetical protein